MPKTPKDFSKSIIYKLCCKDVNIKEIYVGSTTNFTKRKDTHKSSCNNVNGEKYNYYVYQFIRENGRFENWEMVLVEKYPCNDVLELKQRERYWIDELRAELNKIIPSRTYKEWYDDNKDKLRERKREYYRDNKNKIREKRKQYRENNKDKILEKKKAYREANKDKIREKKKAYREANKDKLREKCDCECGAVVNKSSLTRHKKTKKHKLWVENNK